MKTVLVTGGAGFVGSHVCEYYSSKGCRVIALDNLSRASLLGKKSANTLYNWNFLSTLPRVQRVQGSILDFALLKRTAANVDAIIHTAAQTAVTTSVIDPVPDFETNAVGTFNVLEAARQSKRKPAVIVCSTNKVYGDNVNLIPIKELKKRYIFTGKLSSGVREDLGLDLCKHTPYGCSKLTADIYAQEYARLYGLRVGVFRMSCIYGTRQFGVEDQGWVAWFVIAAVTGKPVTIYGNGKQVRDLLWVGDLVRAYDAFLSSKHRHLVLNLGGGANNTLSLLELVDILKERGFNVRPKFAPWRPSDQKIYVSNIRKAQYELPWKTKVSASEGIDRLISWVQTHRSLF